MKIRTTDDLLDRIATDRIWRLREISDLRNRCRSDASKDPSVKTLRRAFVTVAYAHWEGFVKEVSEYYLNYVAMQGLTLEQLEAPFVSLWLFKEHGAELRQRTERALVAVCETLERRRSPAVAMPSKDVISTKSNLNSDVLNEICVLLGLSFKGFEARSLFIGALLGRRNRIAHGRREEVDAEDVENIRDEVISLIDTFRSEIENAAVQRRFARVPPAGVRESA